MYNFEEEYNRIADETMKKIGEALDREIEVETLNEIGAAVCDGILAALHAGENCFPHKIAVQRGKISIVGDCPPDRISAHYFWAMQAGFSDRAEAEEYLAEQRINNPGTQYGLFIDGIPVDYE